MQIHCVNLYDVWGKTERMSENRQLEQEGGRVNRQILFKAKRKDNGEWVEGGYFSEPYTDKKYIIRWNSFGIGFNEFIEVNPDTL